MLSGRQPKNLSVPTAQTFIGSGKVEEVQALAEEFQAEVILFDDELSPRHLRELERIYGEHFRILDRTALILDIFAQHADTREGALQVELAQYEYRLPRLTRAWTHLARQAGGGGGRSGGVGGVGLRGPGETQLEVDRRDIRRRIDHLKAGIGESPRSPQTISLPAPEISHSAGNFGGVYQCRQIDFAEPASQGGCICGRPVIRHLGSDHAPG